MILLFSMSMKNPVRKQKYFSKNPDERRYLKQLKTLLEVDKLQVRFSRFSRRSGLIHLAALASLCCPNILSCQTNGFKVYQPFLLYSLIIKTVSLPAFIMSWKLPWKKRLCFPFLDRTFAAYKTVWLRRGFSFFRTLVPLRQVLFKIISASHLPLTVMERTFTKWHLDQ